MPGSAGCSSSGRSPPASSACCSNIRCAPCSRRRRRRARAGARRGAVLRPDGVARGEVPDALLRDADADTVRDLLLRRGPRLPDLFHDVIRLIPQKREFFDLFTQASANARDIAHALVELLENWPGDKSKLRDIRELEHEGDRLTHELINLLNRTFVTPFDRDDIYRLASVIDDVCDHVDEAADNIDAYEVQNVPDRARE